MIANLYKNGNFIITINNFIYSSVFDFGQHFVSKLRINGSFTTNSFIESLTDYDIILYRSKQSVLFKDCHTWYIIKSEFYSYEFNTSYEPTYIETKIRQPFNLRDR